MYLILSHFYSIYGYSRVVLVGVRYRVGRSFVLGFLALGRFVVQCHLVLHMSMSRWYWSWCLVCLAQCDHLISLARCPILAAAPAVFIPR